MKTITKYIANDNVEFLNENNCINHERNIEIADYIMTKLPSKPDTCDFSNGHGYIQHNATTLLQVRNEFLEFFKRYSDHELIQNTIDKGFESHSSWAGRVIDDYGYHSISKHWYRFRCIDSDLREWGQPYYCYSENTPSGDDFVQLNKN